MKNAALVIVRAVKEMDTSGAKGVGMGKSKATSRITDHGATQATQHRACESPVKNDVILVSDTSNIRSFKDRLLSDIGKQANERRFLDELGSGFPKLLGVTLLIGSFGGNPKSQGGQEDL